MEGEVIHQPSAALFRGLTLPPPLLAAWSELHRGALLAFDPFAALVLDAGPDGLAFRLRPSRG
jgi:hypothetical protein